MTFNEMLGKIIAEYPAIAEEPSERRPGKTWFRIDVKEGAETLVRSNLALEVKASPGMNVVADVPWIGVRRRDITTSFMHGIYIVYLFPTDRSGVYLSLNQGVTHLEGSGAIIDRRPSPKDIPMLRSRARGFRQLYEVPKRFQLYDIDLVPTQPRSRAYQAGHICGLKYSTDMLPDDSVLQRDLNELIRFYSLINSQDQADARLADLGSNEPAPEQDYQIGSLKPHGKNYSRELDIGPWLQARERRKAAHVALLDAIASRARQASLSYKQTKHIDLVVDSRIIIEAKSIANDAITQARAALAQLYHYRFLYRNEYKDAILVAIFDASIGPVDDLVRFLEEQCSIHVLWQSNGVFVGTERSRSVVPWLQ